MEHLFNCHGEWSALAQFAATLPFVGLWLRAMLPVMIPARVHNHSETHRDHS